MVARWNLSEKANVHTKKNGFAVGKFEKGKLRDILLLSAVALLLVFAVWKIFYTTRDETETTVSVTGTENERRLSELLQGIDGVGDVNVMIYETEEGVQSVVVVCDGANDLKVIMNIREAVAAALGTDEKYVKIYQMKE
jgi:hypothetical protein